MLRSFLPGFLLLIIVALPASATESVTFDAEWWNSLTEDGQISAVQGAIDAFSDGYEESTINSAVYLRISADGDRSKAHGIPSQYLYAASDHILSSRAPQFSKTFKTYIDGITDFYENYPAASSATIGYVLRCLSDTPLDSCAHVADEVEHSGH